MEDISLNNGEKLSLMRDYFHRMHDFHTSLCSYERNTDILNKLISILIELDISRRKRQKTTVYTMIIIQNGSILVSQRGSVVHDFSVTMETIIEDGIFSTIPCEWLRTAKFCISLNYECV